MSSTVYVFNGTPDARTVTDAVSMAGSATFASATAGFSSADVTTPRKICIVSGIYVPGSGCVGDARYGYVATGTVSSVGTSGSLTTITLSGINSAAVNSLTGLRLTWGTDNLNALQAALDQQVISSTTPSTYPPYTVAMPLGNYAVSDTVYIRRDNIKVQCDGTIVVAGYPAIGGLLCLVNCENVTWSGGAIDCSGIVGINAVNVSGNFDATAATSPMPPTVSYPAKYCRNVRILDVTAYRARFDGKYAFSLSSASGTFAVGDTVTGPPGPNQFRIADSITSRSRVRAV